MRKRRFLTVLLCMLLIGSTFPINSYAANPEPATPEKEEEIQGANESAEVIQIRILLMTDVNNELHAEDTLSLEAAPEDSVGSVKEKIQTETGLLPELQVLFFDGKALKDEQLLSEHAISNESILHLGIRAETYTVTLAPGDGSGDSVVCRFDDQADIPDRADAESGQFYYVDDDSVDGCVGFCLDEDFCPDSFSAPAGYSFDGWESLDETNYTFLYGTDSEVIFTAKWKAPKKRNSNAKGDPSEVLEAYTWDDLQSCVWEGFSTDPKYSATTVKLMADVDPSSFSASPQPLMTNRDVTIDLNGHTIDRNSPMPPHEDGDDICTVIHVINKTLTITDSSSEGKGKITGAWVKESPGGVYLTKNGALVLQGGMITGNKAGKGGGVYVSNGARFDMTGGEITGNEAAEGGGVYVENGGTFYATGGSIIGNVAKSKDGGGIKNYGKMNLSDCTIKGNSAKLTGGGIRNSSGGDLTLSGCTITENSAEDDGGGVWSGGKDFWIFDGSFTQNEANRGGGIYVSKSNGQTNIKGVIKVTDNSASSGQDLYLGKGQKLTLAGKLGTDFDKKTNIGYIDMAERGVFTQNIGYYYGATPDPFHHIGTSFFCTATGAIPVEYTDDRSELKLVSNWPDLQRLIKEAERGSGNDPIVLSRDYTASTSDDRLEVHGKVTIDLNGHKINRNLTSRKSNGHVIEVFDGGVLTITDSSNPDAGMITGGWSDNGGGIYVNEKGSLNIEGGTIAGNHGAEHGGGIYVLGTLTMRGGCIRDNQASEYGGGICAAGKSKLDIIGAQITGNHSNENGGGIYIGREKPEEDANITNCRITGNRANKNGGGIYIADVKGSVNIGNNTEIDNNRADKDGGGIFLILGTVSMYGGSISGNSALRNGGGIKTGGDVFAARFSASGVKFDGNEAESGTGGAIKNFGKTELFGCNVINNSAVLEGGGIYSKSLKDAALEDDDLFMLDKRPHSAEGESNPGELLLSNCTIKDNHTEKNGGGVYSGHILEIYDGEISGNSATGNGGGVLVGTDTESVSIEGRLRITDNTASGGGSDAYLRPGKKFKCTDKLEAGAKIGVDLEDGDGVLTKDYRKYNGTKDPSSYFIFAKGYDLFLNNSGEAELGSAWASIKAEIENASGDAPVVLDRDFAAGTKDKPIVIPSGKTITVDLNGHTLNRNMTVSQPHPPRGDGGFIFHVQGQLTIQDSSVTEGTITGGCSVYGGGIYVDEGGTLYFESGTVTGNRASIPDYVKPDAETGIFVYTTCLGGGICVDGTLYMTGGFISGNKSDRDGGGICVRDGGTLEMTGGFISGNKADGDGGGILVQEGSTVRVMGSPVVYDNDAAASGKDIYLLDDNQLTVVGAFSTGGHGDTGANMGIAVDDEYEVFGSGYVFTAGYSDNNPTREPASVFTSTDGYTVTLKQVGGKNEAVLTPNTYGETDTARPFIDWNNQININTATLNGHNWMSGLSGERYLNEINLPGSHDAGMYRLEAIKAPSELVSETFAKTQTRYIEDQLAEGSRLLDIRLTPYYDYSTISGYSDDGRNLWICHGNTWIGGTCLALSSNGRKMSFDTVLMKVTEFLEQNPTETVILNVRPELGDHVKVYQRTREALEEYALKKNPSTGEPYLYKESGSNSYFARYNKMPQLKDCRGKIVLLPSPADSSFKSYIGGLNAEAMVNSYFYGGSEYSQLPRPHAATVYREYNEHNPGYDSKELPTDSGDGTPQDTLWEWQLNCTGEDDYVDTYVNGNNPPVRNAHRVNSTLIGDGKPFGLLTTGQYIGWVRMDAFEGKYAEPIWRTNFFDDLEYCTITVESGLSAPNDVTQVFRVLKGTEITIPDNIYKNVHGNLSAWEAQDLTGLFPQNLGTYVPGSTFKAETSVTFRPLWMDSAEIPVSIIWKDADNTDELRPGSISLKVTDLSGNVTHTEIKNAEGWRGAVSSDADKIVPEWEKIVTTPGNPSGTDMDGQYRYVISRDDKGFVIKFIHTPDVKEPIEGDISWKDDHNAAGERPGNVQLSLLAYGEEVQVQPTVTARSTDRWKYSFDDQPVYADGEEILYSVTEESINDYRTYINGFSIMNTYAPDKPAVTQVSGIVNWDDGEDKWGKRPEKVTVRLLADEREIKEAEVEEHFGVWMFSFDDIPVTDAEGKQISYSIEADTTPDYAAPIIEDAGNGYFSITYTLDADDDEKTPAEIVKAPEARQLTYTGEEQTLVTEGICKGGTLLYALGTDDSTAPDPSAFSEDLPADTETGTYYVWYYGKGDIFHTDTRAACVTVTIGRQPAEKGTLTFDLNGGTLDGRTGTITIEANVGDTIRLPGEPSREGYKFLYWKGSEYEAGAEYKVEGDHAFTAEWEKTQEVQKYTITFDANGYGTAPESQTIEEGKKVSKPGDPTADGYTFGGWYTEKGCENSYDFDTAVTKDITLYAKWTKKDSGDPDDDEKKPAVKGTLTFDLSGGTLDGRTGTITIEANVGDTIRLPGAPAREGYKFLYWKGSEYEAGAEYKVEGDHTFTAEWEKTQEVQKYTITFDANGYGTAPESQTVEAGKKVSKPEDPTADGYTFGGWYTEKGCENSYDFDTAVTKDITLYAKWTKTDSEDPKDPDDSKDSKDTDDQKDSGDLKDPDDSKDSGDLKDPDDSSKNNGSENRTPDSSSQSLPTGDNNDIGLWLVLMSASLLGLIMIAAKRRIRRR